jgi:hypothetical protein
MLLLKLINTSQNQPTNKAYAAILAVIFALIISLPCSRAADNNDSDQALQGSVQSQALQGLIKEEVVSPTRNVEPHQLEDMPLPVMPKLTPGKPLAGQADDNTLKGKAQDQGSGLQGQAQKEGSDFQSPPPAAFDKDKPLQANVSKETAPNEDPDADDAELMVQWDRWRNRLLWAIQSGVDEYLSNPPPESMQWDPKVNAMVSRVPLGIETWFTCQVTPSHKILNIKLLHSSGSQIYDQAVLAAISQLQGSQILAFPSRSKRNIVTQMAGLKTTETFQRKYFQFGDVERRAVTN